MEYIVPYINQNRRKDIAKGEMADIPGELNYLFSVLAKSYWDNSSQNYQAINDIIGALEGAKLEFYRRIAVPYEDQKIKENGDVY